MTIQIAPLHAKDRAGWNALARGYKAFYETPTTDAEYDRAWLRLLTGERVHGLGASLDGKLVGITHYFFHTSVWTDRVCYLQDLFVDETVRGRGVARALIEAVATEARAQQAARLYWMTRESNHTARALYDKLAKFNGFIRYEYPMA
ncbi:GNAT family N-acetyltransferase [Piscinibacter terrae]|uniref:GNAT family N-acetyltransferase n=1 Tax=Piscinibacter terrae TaxID=2496871 RepID=A0A3N7HU79_9BURK|nr:GNAT family N-acetyltransferase [Albitalea terrae]RQP24856.1 GNAT family N-acetyltransferase [Albitalea terrae]